MSGSIVMAHLGAQYIESFQSQWACVLTEKPLIACILMSAPALNTSLLFLGAGLMLLPTHQSNHTSLIPTLAVLLRYGRRGFHVTCADTINTARLFQFLGLTACRCWCLWLCTKAWQFPRFHRPSVGLPRNCGMDGWRFCASGGLYCTVFLLFSRTHASCGFCWMHRAVSRCWDLLCTTFGK